MTALAQRLKDKYFRQDHPYRAFEREVERYLRPEHTLLDAGCGRMAPILAKYRNKARRLIGVDLVDFAAADKGLELYHCDLGAMPIEDNCVDVTMSRSVMEHVTDPARVYCEIYRVLKPDGRFIFLTANLWDYASIIAKLIPTGSIPGSCPRPRGARSTTCFRSRTAPTPEARSRDGRSKPGLRSSRSATSASTHRISCSMACCSYWPRDMRS